MSRICSNNVKNRLECCAEFVLIQNIYNLLVSARQNTQVHYTSSAEETLNKLTMQIELDMMKRYKTSVHQFGMIFWFYTIFSPIASLGSILLMSYQLIRFLFSLPGVLGFEETWIQEFRMIC